MPREAWGRTEVSPDAVSLPVRASSSPPRCRGAAGGQDTSPQIREGKGGEEGAMPKSRVGLGLHKPASHHHKCCPAAAGFITVRAISTPSLPPPFLRLVKVKRGLKCYSHSVYFAGAQNFLLIIRALLNGNVPLGPGSLQSPVQDG